MITQDVRQEAISQHGLPHLLPDLPAEDDAFGAHQRVAEAIADLIESETEGGKAIALMGKWGSGKSTVVKLLEKTFLRNDPDVELFVFDAWAHQGDPLRRSFLHELIVFLGGGGSQDGWISEHDWLGQLESITLPKDTSEKFSEAALGFAGPILVILTLLMPLGIGLLVKGSTTETFLKGLKHWELGAVLLSLAPAAALVMWLLSLGYSVIKRVVRGLAFLVCRKEIWKEAPISRRSSPFAFLIHKPPQTEASKTVRSPEPTSVEFRNFFFDLIGSALQPSFPQRKLVIVMDNLDRVDSKDAGEIWATMRTFFDPGQGASAAWKKRFWLIVPFDQTSLSKLWESQSSEGLALSNNAFADIFIDKTFQAQFHVAPPVLTSWKQFLIDKLNEAFSDRPEVTSDELHRLYLLYSLKLTEPMVLPTPRDIKMFVNRLVTLYIKWKTSIPLLALGAYATLEKGISCPANDFKAEEAFSGVGRILADRLQSHGNESTHKAYGLKEYLTAIHYNVSPDQALHMLYAEEVAGALSNGRPQEIEPLIDRVPGIVAVIENVTMGKAEVWATTEPLSLAKAALTLDGVAWPEGVGWQQIWAALGNCAKTVSDWGRPDEALGEGLAAILEHNRDQNYEALARPLLEALYKMAPYQEEVASLAEGSAQRIEMFNKIRPWLDTTIPVLHEVEQSGKNSVIKKTFSVPGDARFYFATIGELCRTPLPDEIVQHFVTNAEAEEFRPALVDLFANGYRSGRFVESLNDPIFIAKKIPGQWPLPDVCKKLHQWYLAADELKEAPEILGCVEGLASCAIHGVADEAHTFVNNFWSDPRCKSLLEPLLENPRATALGMFIILYALRQGVSQQHRSEAATKMSAFKDIYRGKRMDREVTEAFGHLLLKYRKLREITHKLAILPSGPFIANLIQAVARRVEDYKYYLPDFIIQNHRAWVQEQGGLDVIGHLIRPLIQHTSYIEKLAQTSYQDKLDGLFEMTIRVGPHMNLSRRSAYFLEKISEIASKTS